MCQQEINKRAFQSIRIIRWLIAGFIVSLLIMGISSAYQLYNSQIPENINLVETFLPPGLCMIAIILLIFYCFIFYARWPWEKLGFWWPYRSEKEYMKVMLDIEVL